jgi:O-antigen/teichoic acid export membrane protein
MIVLARSDVEARRVGSVAMMLSAATAVCVSLIGAGMALAFPLIARGATKFPLGIVEVAVLMPLFIIAWGIAQVFTFSNLRADRVRVIAGFKVAQSGLAGILQVATSTWRAVPGLILGNLAGWLLLAVAGVRTHLAKGGVRRDLRLRTVKAVVRRHARFPRYVMPNQLVDNLSNQAPLVLIGSFVSLSAAGHYGLAIMMLSAPAALVGQAVGQVFLQHIGRHQGEPAALASAMYRVWLALASLGIVPFAALAVFGPTIFHFAFGARWAEAGVAAQMLAPLIFVRFVSSPTSSIYLKLGMQREQWWFALAAMVYRPAAYALGAFGFDLRTQIAVHVVAEICAIVAYNAFALRRLGVSLPIFGKRPT